MNALHDAADTRYALAEAGCRVVPRHNYTTGGLLRSRPIARQSTATPYMICKKNEACSTGATK
eukprot:4134066-Pleurochrysis_carterae.AAC.1